MYYYKNLSKLHVNNLVAMYALPVDDFEVIDKKVIRLKTNGIHLNEPVEFNPHDNPSDAWPIIVDNRINIITSFLHDGQWLAKHSWVEVVAEDKNPLRAAMICYLMMKEVK